MFGDLPLSVKSFSNSVYYTFFPNPEKPEGPIKTIPQELVLEIFDHLNFHELGVSSQVSKNWNVLANDSTLLKHVIYREKVFNPEDWNFYFKDISLDQEEHEEAFKSLPQEIGKIFKSHSLTFPNQKWADVHAIAWIPKGLTINSFQKLTKGKCFEINQDDQIWDDVVKKYGDIATEKSAWVVLTKVILPNSQNMKFAQAKKLINKINEKDQTVYVLPTLFEAYVLSSLFFFKFEIRTFLVNSTWCQECLNEDRCIIDLTSKGPRTILYSEDQYHDRIGVAGVYKFFK